MTHVSQPYCSKVAWSSLESEKTAPRQCEVLFQHLFFFKWKFFFFLWWFLMHRPYAGSFWAHNRAQCADRPRLPALPIPTSSLCWKATNWALWEPPTAPASLVRLKHPPTVLPRTPSAHIHLTLPFSVLPMSPTTLKEEKNVSRLSGWSLMSWMWLPHLLYHLLIKYSQEAQKIQSLFIMI